MKICAIGNSYLGAIKNGWDRLRDAHSGTEIVFFASPQDKLGALQPEGRRLITSDATLAQHLAFTSGGHEAVDVDHFDAFLVYGMAFNLRGARLNGPVSQAVLQATLHDMYTATLNHRIAAMLEGLGVARPIVVSPSPLGADPPVAAFDPAFHCYGDLIAALNRAFEGRFVFLGQPPATFDGWQTRDAYCKGSYRLQIAEGIARPHPDSDKSHMNAAFGEAMLETLLSWLARHGLPAAAMSTAATRSAA